MIGSVITGAIIGAVASRIMHSRHGFFMNMVIGMAGASLGHFLFWSGGLYSSRAGRLSGGSNRRMPCDFSGKEDWLI